MTYAWLYSKRIFLKIRSKLRFSRRGYFKIGTEGEEDTIIERELVEQIFTGDFFYVVAKIKRFGLLFSICYCGAGVEPPGLKTLLCITLCA